MTYREEKHQSLSTPSPVFMGVLITSSADDFLPNAARSTVERRAVPSFLSSESQSSQVCVLFFQNYSKIHSSTIRSFIHKLE